MSEAANHLDTYLPLESGECGEHKVQNIKRKLEEMAEEQHYVNKTVLNMKGYSVYNST